MKRSTMIAQIELLIQECERDQLGVEESAERLLDFIENCGMIPPNQYACTNEFRFEWEPEDDI